MLSKLCGGEMLFYQQIEAFRQEHLIGFGGGLEFLGALQTDLYHQVVPLPICYSFCVPGFRVGVMCFCVASTAHCVTFIAVQCVFTPPHLPVHIKDTVVYSFVFFTRYTTDCAPIPVSKSNSLFNSQDLSG